MSKNFIKLGLFSVLFLSATSGFAAKAIDLSGQDSSILRSFTQPAAKTFAAGVSQSSQLKQISETTDFNQTKHIRIKQTYAGFPVIGGEGVIHIPNSSANNAGFMQSLQGANAGAFMNGTLYQGLEQDLQGTPNTVFNDDQAKKAISKAITNFKIQSSNPYNIHSQESALKIYVDKQNKAHWVFHVKLNATSPSARPALPTFLMDAVTFKVYKQWDEVKTLHDDRYSPLEKVVGGGFGGNEKMGKLFYDGKKEPFHFSALDIRRDPAKKICYLFNEDVTVIDYRKGLNKIALFNCDKPSLDYNNVIYWNNDSDEINGGYSPNNDALYAGQVIVNMYRNWYQVPAVTDDFGKPLMVSMVTHVPYIEKGKSYPYDNAYWHPILKKMYYGDGYRWFHPLTSLGVGAHEISHGFTDQRQNSGLIYDGESGGMNEAFSDMAAQAAEYYTSGTNSWQIGPEITKTTKLPVLRYMDKPDDDCKFTDLIGKPVPGKNCSFQHYDVYKDYVATHVNDYKEGKDEKGEPVIIEDNRLPNVHFSSGIYNHAFYVLAREAGWNVKKAFDVMVQANQFYWTEDSTFAKGACGVVSATEDYAKNDPTYTLAAIYKAFDTVGIDARGCPVRKD